MKKTFWSKTLAGLAAAAMIVTFTASAQAKTWKMSFGDAAGGTQWETGTQFAKILEEKAGGKVKFGFFPNGQLGSEQDTVNDCAMGTLDFSVLAVNNLTPFSPSVGLLTLPYMIQSLDDAKKLTQGDMGKELAENTLRDAGVRIVAWTYSGFRVLTNSKRPVKTLDDLKGLVIRVPKNAIMIETYKSWGINPTPMAWSETFTALQQKVVDGQDNPFITVHAMKFYEIQKYITTVRYLFSLEPIIMSEELFQKQSPEMQKMILDAGKEATAYSADWLIKTEDSIKEDLISKGMVIDAAADGEKAWIEKATSAVWPKYIDSIGGQAKLDAALKLLGR